MSLLTDLKEEDFHVNGDVYNQYHIDYLSKSTDEKVDSIDGLSFGSDRLIVPLSVGSGSNYHWIYFIIDTGSPITTLSKKSMELCIRGGEVIKINGYKIPKVEESSGFFADMNLLGSDFLRICNSKFIINYYSQPKTPLKFNLTFN